MENSKEDESDDDEIDEDEETTSKLKKGDCVLIKKGQFMGYYAMVTDDSFCDELEIQYFERKFGKYVLKPLDLDSRHPDDITKVTKVAFDSRSRYTFE